MSNFLYFVLSRLKEASTWRGIVAVIAAFGLAFSPEQAAAIVTAGVALIGAIEVFRKDLSPPA